MLCVHETIGDLNKRKREREARNEWEEGRDEKNV